jgi:CRISPR system Cascade subunit CasE
MSLNLLQFNPDPLASARWFAAENLLAPAGADSGYAWHALLCAVFGKALAPKPFRALSRRGRPLQLLAYSGEAPAQLAQAARDFALPQALAAAGLPSDARFAAKPLSRFASGRRLGFSCLVRPTVRTDRAGEREKTAEIDAFLAAWRRTGERPDRKTVYEAWARERIERSGARVIDLRLDGLDQAPVLRRRHATGALKPVEGHSAALVGVLEVSEPDAFAALLARGVGRHRAFGFGMLLLSPA